MRRFVRPWNTYTYPLLFMIPFQSCNSFHNLDVRLSYCIIQPRRIDILVIFIDFKSPMKVSLDFARWEFFALSTLGYAFSLQLC